MIRRPAVLAGLSALYLAQGVPLGIAAEYLPVVLRERHVSFTAIGLLSWLQLPWALKPLWAKLGDRPGGRLHVRRIVVGLQLALAATLARYSIAPLARAVGLWLGLTALAAVWAATQDVFVDSLALRTLGPDERGLGNSAQVGAYRLGIVLGGAGLLLGADRLGERAAVLALAAVVVALAVGVRALPIPGPERYARHEAGGPRARRGAGWKPLFGAGGRSVLAVAVLFKLGLHGAASLIKPALVDAGWSKSQIGSLAVTVGTLGGVLGSLAGGLCHRRAGEVRALWTACMLQVVGVLPLLLLVTHASRLDVVGAALALEHAVSGFGTTILFAALMGAVAEEHGALQLTVLSTANGLSLSAAGLYAGWIADRWGVCAAFAASAALGLASIPWLWRWRAASATLRGGG